MNDRLIDFLFDLAQKPLTAKVFYPPNVGTLDPNLLEADVETLEDSERQGYLVISGRSHSDGRLRAVMVGLTGKGYEWASRLKG